MFLCVTSPLSGGPGFFIDTVTVRESFMANTENQRTYALIGTGGCGKTSLAEMLLFQSGAVNRLGKIEDGTTALDIEPEEIKRRGSIQPGFGTYVWNGNRHFIVDLPGDGNFTGDMDMILPAVDAAVFVIDAVDGVRPLTKKQWVSVKKAGLPACCFINKMDRDRADFNMAYSSLSSMLGIKPVLAVAPIGEKEDFKGVVSILSGKAYFFEPDGGLKEGPVPADMADAMKKMRDATIENIAESDDALMEKYLDEGALTDEEINAGLRNGITSGTLVPVLVGSALENKGGTLLLDLINKAFPSPLQQGHRYVEANGENMLEISENGPASCFICKTIADPFSGQLSVARVLSGTISGDSVLKNSRTQETERLGTPILMNGKTQTQAKESFGPGAIVAFAKLKNTGTGDTLADEKSGFTLMRPELPPQLISFALAPQNKGEEDKVFTAVQKLLDEDVALNLYRDEDTGEILVRGMGQLHVETAIEKARRRYKVEILLKTPKVPYRETFKGKAQVQGRHKKQSGGRGQFGDCWVEFEPLARGSGYQFEDAIVGGVVPRQYIPAVDKGIQESAVRGYLAGYPMVDFKARLYDGTYHTVDSSEMAFKIAGSLAFKKAMEVCKPVLLEPIASMIISIPDEYMGDVIGDLSGRRGKVVGSDSIAGLTEIKANVPANEILRYAQDLRSMTGGQGVFTLEFSHYEEAPPHVTEKVVAEYAKVKKDEE